LSVAVKIQLIAGRTLTTPLDVIVEPDDEGFIARCVDLPLFGYGDDQYEAVECLRKEIDSLYHDLIQDEDATEEWLQIRRFFEKNVT
jgi:ATP-dependent exoDNAse (exonuclease V) beta subunit